MKNWFKKQSKYTTKEKRILIIINKIIEDDHTSYILSKDEYAIVNENKKFYCYINSGSIIFTNGVYFSEENFSLKFTDSLMLRVAQKKEEEFKKIKDKILNKSKNIYNFFYNIEDGKENN